MKFFEFLKTKKTVPKVEREKYKSSKILLKNKEDLDEGETNNYSRRTFEDKVDNTKYHSFETEKIEYTDHLGRKKSKETKKKPEEKIIASQISQRLLKIACNVSDTVRSPNGEYFSTEDLNHKKIHWDEFRIKFPAKVAEAKADTIIFDTIMNDSDHGGGQNTIYFDNGTYYLYDFEHSNSFFFMPFYINKNKINNRELSPEVIIQLKEKSKVLLDYYKSPDGAETFAAILKYPKTDLTKVFLGLVGDYEEKQIMNFYVEFVFRLESFQKYIDSLDLEPKQK